MDFAISGVTILVMVISSVINFTILYFIIKAAVRNGNIEAQQFLQNASPN